MTDPNSKVEYRDCPGLIGYRVGTDGSFWSAWHRGGVSGKGQHWLGLPWIQIKGTIEIPTGIPYLRVSPKIGNKFRHRFLHRLILEAFVGPVPAGLQTRHLDGDSLNNALANLCYGTARENKADTVRHGRILKGESHRGAKLTEIQVRDIRSKITSGMSDLAISNFFSVSESTIRAIRHRNNWGWLT